jgi:eukaryotic-like serine/threonine-protein kinase
MLDQTQAQHQEELARARELSLTRWRPPAELPGYEPQHCLGVGAFGEVWLALDRATNRRVAIKFFSPRASQDWSQLAREVEKLAYLSADRYVVQLLDVGWDASPPYYVMEYIEQGSLESKLQRDGPLPVSQAVEIFRELVIGLSHAHSKGVLHCDLKPANVLLDQDLRPRLADFGQSRLAHEQQPALGTLFYMAPEQADSTAKPDARWDVYALGALLHCMLTGAPPYRDTIPVERLETATELTNRLRIYRQLIAAAPSPSKFRENPAVDHALAEILDRCLALRPADRFRDVQQIQSALEQRSRKRALRPLFALGAIGPTILVGIVALVAWLWFSRSWEQSRAALTARALESLRFASRNVAVVAGNALEQRFETVERIAADPELSKLLAEINSEDELITIGGKLSDPDIAEMQLQPYREQLKQHPLQEKLQKHLQTLITDQNRFEYASWFVTDARGLQLARSPESSTIGHNYAWRSYFHGGTRDHERDWRVHDGSALRRTHLSAVYRSQTTKHWSVAISTPVRKQDGSQEFLGVLALTFEVGKNLIHLEDGKGQFPVLIDTRVDDKQSLIVQHPIFENLTKVDSTRLEEFLNQSVDDKVLQYQVDGSDNYVDPVGKLPGGEEFRQRWLAGWQPVLVRERPTGWYVLVQQSYDTVLGKTLDELRRGFVWSSALALIFVALVSGVLWWYCLRMLEYGSTSNRMSG